jgi:hypothetical protein
MPTGDRCDECNACGLHIRRCVCDAAMDAEDDSAATISRLTAERDEARAMNVLRTFDFFSHMAGATIRSCRHCGVPVFGGPNACESCTSIPSLTMNARVDRFIADVMERVVVEEANVKAALDTALSRLRRVRGVRWEVRWTIDTGDTVSLPYGTIDAARRDAQWLRTKHAGLVFSVWRITRFAKARG